MFSRRCAGSGSLILLFLIAAICAYPRPLDAQTTQASRASAPDRDAARALADQAREAVLAAEPGAAEALARATQASLALGLETHEEIELALHIQRSRMLALAGVAADARSALMRDLIALGAQARASDAHAARAFALVYLAELAAASGQADAAQRYSDRALLVAETPETWLAHVGALELQAEAQYAAGETPGALYAYRRARKILARRRARLSAASFLEHAGPVHERLADLLLQASARGSEQEQVLIREAVEALEDLKVAELREYFGDSCLSNLEQTTPEVLPNTTLLYPVLLPDRVVLLVGRDGRFERILAPIGPERLRETSGRLRRALQDPTTNRFRRAAAELYDALIRPIPAAMRPADSTLTVVAPAPLREIPLASLYDDRAKRFLIEEISIAALPTLRIVPPEPIDPRRARLLAAGLSQATGEFEALPSVEREIEAVGRRFSTTRQLGDEFSKASFERALELKAFDLIHIASHGRFDADASESYLVTADGRLGLRELAEIIARTRHRTSRPIELLTLSACETAIGDDRSVLGLAGIAVQSGARSAVATLWRVNDEAAARLFEVFYAELGREGTSRARALQRAQLDLLADRRFRHPVFWSPFLLLNSWR